MAVRRDKGMGSITYDQHADRWVGRIDLGTDPAGRRRRAKVTARTRAEARRKLDALRDQRRDGVDITQLGTTVDSLARLWLDRGLSSDLTANTRANYASMLEQHVLPHLGRRKVSALTPEHVESLLDGMANRGYSARTLRLTLSLLRRVLAFGQRRGLTVRNVADLVQAPAGPTKARSGLTADQARALLGAARADRLGGLITVSLLLGLRPGEATGLTWSALDLDGDPPTLAVQASLRRTTAGMVLAPPKTATSRRTIALPSPCVEALRRQAHLQGGERVAAGAAWANHQQLVFTTEAGTPLDPSNVRRVLNRVADAAGLGHIHPHQLRHAAASLLSDQGVPLEQIADLLGHRSPTITADIYRHPLAELRDTHLQVMTDLATDEREP